MLRRLSLTGKKTSTEPLVAIPVPQESKGDDALKGSEGTRDKDNTSEVPEAKVIAPATGERRSNISRRMSIGFLGKSKRGESLLIGETPYIRRDKKNVKCGNLSKKNRMGAFQQRYVELYRNQFELRYWKNEDQADKEESLNCIRISDIKYVEWFAGKEFNLAMMDDCEPAVYHFRSPTIMDAENWRNELLDLQKILKASTSPKAPGSSSHTHQNDNNTKENLDTNEQSEYKLNLDGDDSNSDDFSDSEVHNNRSAFDYTRTKPEVASEKKIGQESSIENEKEPKEKQEHAGRKEELEEF